MARYKTKIVRLHHFFLFFKNRSSIIVYNAVRVENTARQTTKTISAANRQSFLRIYANSKGVTFMAVSYKNSGNY